MVKENIIPATEMVAELKDEYKTPSYEEFLKNYESESKVNYDDLSGGDMSEMKGYGPCSVCDKEVRWINLYISCPASGCVNQSLSSWTHSPGCGSILQVSNKCRIRCSGCDFNCHVKDYSIACSNHLRIYKAISYDSFTKSLNLSFKGFANGREKEVVRDLIMYLYEHEW